jgi:aconitate hydratase
MNNHEFHSKSKGTLETLDGKISYCNLSVVEEALSISLDRLPFSIRVLFENVLRHATGELVGDNDLLNILQWRPDSSPNKEFPFMPERVLLQDFTGVPAVVDLAALRSAISRMGGDPNKVNPVVPADLVIDHSVQVDHFGSSDAFHKNVQREFERNQERYGLLQWAQKAFSNFRVVPPGTGIVHQVNLEYLATVIAIRDGVAFPDTLVGTDSHTTMINGLSVLGWGVGGIEAEAVLLGQPYYMQMPEVVGLRLTGQLPEGSTATDLVLTITQLLRAHGVVEKFVEFFGPGLAHLPLTDRATIANMAPEYGATVGFFPIDKETIRYLEVTGRKFDQIDLVERYAKTQGLFYSDTSRDPLYSQTLELDIGTIEPSLAGPRRPQERVTLDQVKPSFLSAMDVPANVAPVTLSIDGQSASVNHGIVAIAAITSCTNTSNPSVMVGAGLLAKNAVERGLSRQPWVKTSMAPGSKVVSDYLENAGLTPYLDRLGFDLVGYGCTTCIGNSGPLPDAVSQAVNTHDLIATAVLSGNRNFEGRIHPQVKANYLASPMLVVAYALAGRIDVDLTKDPLGHDDSGAPVYLQELWPSQEEISQVITDNVKPEAFLKSYANVFSGDSTWGALEVPDGDQYNWNDVSSYVREVPFFQDFQIDPPDLQDIAGARVLVSLGDSVTTDHISPAGSIPPNAPAGQYLKALGVEQRDFNTFGARRGNHEVMMRGTFGNPRLRNKLVDGQEGDWTLHQPSGDQVRIYDASIRYREEGVPLIVLAGKEYGAGSSRDWAAKGPNLLGVRATIAQSYERIHRSNLVGMGILPLQFNQSENSETLGLTGRESFDISGIASGLQPGGSVQITAHRDDGTSMSFTAIARIDTLVEMDYYHQGGVLQTVLRRILRENPKNEL